MAGTVHRLGETSWGCGQEASTTDLVLSVALDNSLPAGGNLILDLSNMSGFVPVSCATWALSDGADLATATANAATTAGTGVTALSGSNANKYACVVAEGLTSMVSYGVVFSLGANALPTSLSAGVYGPISVETRFGSATDGPVYDSNAVYDLVTVLDAPDSGMELSAAKKEVTVNGVANADLQTIGDDIVWVFTYSFDGNNMLASDTDPDGWMIEAPYEIVVTLANQHQDASGNPGGYTWNNAGNLCENTQFGETQENDEETGEAVEPFNLGSVACTQDADDAEVLRIPVASQDFATDPTHDPDGWTNFLMVWEFNILNPTDFIGSTDLPIISTTIEKNGMVVLQLGSDVTCSECRAYPPDELPASQIEVLVSFGVDGTNANDQGDGVYSLPYCLTNSDVHDSDDQDFSNCYDYDTQGTPAPRAYPSQITNAITFTWSPGVNIPNDDTTATVECSLSDAAEASATQLLIIQSSVQAAGFGSGNCWYAGVKGDSGADANTQTFECVDMGAVDLNSKNRLSFQFLINGDGVKAMASGVVDEDTMPDTMTCDLVIQTGSSSGSPSDWYSVSKVVDVDGGSSSVFRKYETFISTGNSPSGFQQPDHDVSSAAPVSMSVLILILDSTDTVGIAGTGRERDVPFVVDNTDGTAEDPQTKWLIASLYGGTNYAASAPPTLATAITDGDNTAGISAYATEFSLSASSSGGYLRFETTQYGGDGCGGVDAGCDAGDNSCNNADLTQIFMVNGQDPAQICHGSVTFTFTDAWDTPAHLTTFRGRGEYAGTGTYAESNQGLNDFFFTLRYNDTGYSWALQTLMHTYTSLDSANVLASTFDGDAGELGIQIGYPMWTDTTDDDGGDDKNPNNLGKRVVNVIKINIAQSNPEQYVGFFAPRMWPFMHTDGGNRIEIVSDRDGAACYSYGQQTGAGDTINLIPGLVNPVAGEAIWSQYGFPWTAYLRVNIIICDLTSTTTDAGLILIPALQMAADGSLLDVDESEETWGDDATWSTVSGTGVGWTGLWNLEAWSSTQDVSITGSDGEFIGYWVVVGADVYLNQVTGFADYGSGGDSTQETVGMMRMALRPAQQQVARGIDTSGGGAGVDDGGLDAGFAYGSTALTGDDVDLTPPSASASTTFVGDTFLATLTIGNSDQAYLAPDWLMQTSIIALCGDVDLIMGSLGDVGTDEDNITTTGKCHSFDWNYPAETGATVLNNMRCYFCNGAASGVAASSEVFFSEFQSPSYLGLTVQGIAAAVVGSDVGGATDYSGLSVSAYWGTDEVTATKLNVQTVAGCDGPSSVEKSILGQEATFTIKTQNPIAQGTTLRWYNDGQHSSGAAEGGAQEFKVNDWASHISSPVSGVGVITCGDESYDVVPSIPDEASGLRLTAELPTSLLAAEAGSPACIAGDVDLLIKVWDSTIPTTALETDNYAMDVTCWVEAGANPNQSDDDSDDANAEVAYALGDPTNQGFEFDQTKDGTVSYLEYQSESRVPDLINTYGTFQFKPKVSGVKFWTGETVATFTFGDVNFGDNPVCQVTTSNGAAMSESIESCVVSGAGVTLTWGADKQSIDFVVKVLNGGAWSQAGADTTLTGNLVSYGHTIRSAPTANDDVDVLLLDDPTAAPADGAADLAVTKTYPNTLDTGSLQFDITTKTIDAWGADDMASIMVPTYFQPNLGTDIVCTVSYTDVTTDPANPADPVTEEVYCVADTTTEDWCLCVWGPTGLAPLAADEQFSIIVSGVKQNAVSTFQNFQVYLTGTNTVVTTVEEVLAEDGVTVETPASETSEQVAVSEMGQVADAADGTNPGINPATSQKPIKIWSMTKTSDIPRGSTNLNVVFYLDTDSGLGTTSDLISVDLPCFWGPGFTSSTTATLKQYEDNTSTTTVDVATTVSTEGGMSLKLVLTSPAVLAVTANYTLEIKNVLTPEDDSAIYGHVQVSAGASATGVITRSVSDWADVITDNDFSYGDDLTEIDFIGGRTATVIRGTYMAVDDMICVGTASGDDLNQDLSVSYAGTDFTLFPETWEGELGDAGACGCIGAQASTQSAGYSLNLAQDSTSYSELPTLDLWVSDALAVVTATVGATCALGGYSEPLSVSVTDIPFVDLVVTLGVTPFEVGTDAENPNPDPSRGLTAPLEPVTFSLDTDTTQLLVAECAGAGTGTDNLAVDDTRTLTYVLSGTNAAQFELAGSASTLTLTVVAAPVFDEAYEIPVSVAEGATAGATSITYQCPSTGTAWIALIPTGDDLESIVFLEADEVEAEYQAVLLANEVLLDSDIEIFESVQDWMLTQMQREIVTDATVAMTTAMPFATASRREYSALVWCSDLVGNLYATAEALPVVAVDNGDVVKEVTFTFAEGDVVDSAVAQTVLCTLAESLTLPWSQVSLSDGTICGQESPVSEYAASDDTEEEETATDSTASEETDGTTAESTSTEGTEEEGTTATSEEESEGRLLQETDGTTAESDATDGTDATEGTTEGTEGTDLEVVVEEEPVVIPELVVYVQPDPTADTALTLEAFQAQIDAAYTDITAAIIEAGHDVTIPAAPVAALLAAEVEVNWDELPQNGDVTTTTVTVKGSLDGPGRVYCLMDATGVPVPEEISGTTDETAPTDDSTTVVDTTGSDDTSGTGETTTGETDGDATGESAGDARMLQGEVEGETTTEGTDAPSDETSTGETAGSEGTDDDDDGEGPDEPITVTSVTADELQNLEWDADALYVEGDLVLRSKTTTAEDLLFTFTWTAEPGNQYRWICQATSDNPNPAMALYVTEPPVASIAVSESLPVVPTGDASIFATVFSALCLLIAAFYY